MKKNRLVIFILLVCLVLTAVLYGCDSDDKPASTSISSSKDLNSLIEKSDRSKVEEILNEEYFAKYCNEETISVLYEKFKSKAIMRSALSKANDNELQNKRVIALSYNDETVLYKENHYFTAKELIDNFDKGMVAPKSLDSYIKSKLKNPSTLKYVAVYFYRAQTDDDSNIGFMAEVWFSAENSLGGTIDTKWFVTFDKQMETLRHSEQSYLTLSEHLDGNIWEE